MTNAVAASETAAIPLIRIRSREEARYCRMIISAGEIRLRQGIASSLSYLMVTLSGQIFKMGIPLALQSAAVHMSFLFVAKMINSLGVTASAGICVFALLVEMPGRCLMPGCNGLISAQGFVKLSITLALVDAFIGRIFFCWLLGVFFGLGLKGFLLGYAMGTYLTAVPGFVYYISGMWKKRKLLV